MNPITLHNRYYYAHISQTEKTIYRQIYDSFQQGGTKAKVVMPPNGAVSHDRLFRLMEFVIVDNPQLFHLEPTFMRIQPGLIHNTVIMNTVYTPQEYRSLYERLIRQVDSIVRMAAKYPPELEKLRFLHDYLADTIQYDYGDPGDRNQLEVHTVIGALLNRRCVCDGFARAYRLLCDRLRLSSAVVIGDATGPEGKERHAWNLVLVGGKPYHVDVTWDSGAMTPGGIVPEHYFLRSDAVFRANHIWTPKLYPPMPLDYPRRDPLIRTEKEFADYLYKQCKAGRRQIPVNLPAGFPGKETLPRWLRTAMDRHPFFYTGIGNGCYTYNPNTHCAIVYFGQDVKTKSHLIRPKRA